MSLDYIQCHVKTIWPWKSDVDTVFSQAYGIYKIGAKEAIELMRSNNLTVTS